MRPVATGSELETAAFHILNGFDIPFGFVRADDDPDGDDHTLWSSLSNLGDLRYVVRTYDNPVPQCIDLNTVDFDIAEPLQVEPPTGGFAELELNGRPRRHTAAA